ncbi:MAG: hypothetical protein KTR25_08160 [Myxococcales bacterium]|nr:hypothetical protein [Myxococcales bacterium]
MAGRTERVNAKDLIDRADGIFFESDVVRSWLQQLAKRATGTLEAAQKNKYFDDEFKAELDELNAIVAALNTATTNLECISLAVAKREGKASA